MSFAPGAPQPFPSQAGPTQPVAPPTPGARYAGPGGLSGPGAPGQPRPAGSTVLSGCVPAAPGRRTAAAFTDGLVSAAPAVVASIAVQVGVAKELPGLVVVGVVLGLGWLVGFVVVGLRFVQTGVSPGKRATGLRLVDLRTGGAPGFAAWGRFALASLGGAVLVGWVVAVVQILANKDGERRAWYDGLTGLVLLDIEAGRDPFLAVSAMPATGAAPRRGGPLDGDLVGDAPTWVGPSVSSLAPGQHGTQFGQQRASGFAPPVPTVPPVPAVPPVPPVPLPGTSIPVGVVRLPPVPPPPPVVSAPPVMPVVPVPPVPPVAAPPVVASPVAPPPVAPPSGATPARAIFTFASGQVHEATGAGVIGRAPRPSRTGEMPVIEPGVLTVTDVTRTVSKAHLSFRVEASGVWLTDLGSTNGSTIIGRYGAPTALAAGAAVLAAYGSTVTVGELSFAIAAAPVAPDDGGDLEHTIHRDRR